MGRRGLKKNSSASVKKEGRVYKYKARNKRRSTPCDKTIWITQRKGKYGRFIRKARVGVVTFDEGMERNDRGKREEVILLWGDMSGQPASNRTCLWSLTKMW